MYRTLATVLVSMLVVLGLVGLTFSASVAEPADFRFLNGTEPQTLDPALMTGQPEGRVAESIFEGLVRKDAKTMTAAPGVAERWDVSADGRTYTFHLREDAVWSDGTPLTTADFLYSWKRLLNPETGAEYAYILYMVKHAETLNTATRKAAALTSLATEALPELLKTHNNAVPAVAAQAFLRDHELHNLLQAAAPEVTRLLAADHGGFTPADVATLRSALQGMVTSAEQELAHAQAHFGVDEGVYAPDSRTLVVELRSPTPYFLDIVSFYPTYPVPRHAVERVGNAQDWFLPGKIVSNGAFSLESWVVNDHLRLKKSPTYWGRDEVHLNVVDVLSLENETTSLNLYLTGGADWLPGTYPRDLVDHLRHRPDFYRNAGMAVYYYQINTTRKPFNDKRVREALNLAIDRDVITREVTRLGEIPATSMTPPGIPGYTAPETPLRLNVARAKELLAQAGFPDGAGFPEVGILFNTLEAHRKIAEVIADQLRRNLGIEAKAYNQEWQSYLQTRRQLDYDLARSAWVGDYTDPNTFLDMWVTNGGQNRTGFSSAEYDALITAASDVHRYLQAPDALAQKFRFEDTRQALASAQTATTPDDIRRLYAALRMKLFAEAEGILLREEFPVIPIYFYVQSGLVSPRVHGFYSQLQHPDGSRSPNLQDVHPLRDVRVDKREAR